MTQKYIETGIEILLLGAVELLALTVLNGEYLFGWAAHNWSFYLILSAIPILLTLFNKTKAGIIIATGITGGIFVGNYLGNYIKEANTRKIIEGMTGEELHRISQHPGFVIWMIILIVSLLIGSVVQMIITKGRRKVFR